MATKLIMPKLGMTMSEGVVARWLKSDGDQVAKDEPVAVIMSKKITYQLLAPVAGILRVVCREKETRSINATIGWLTAPGEAVPAGEAEAGSAAEAPAAISPALEQRSVAAAPVRTGFVPASPAARRLAQEKGIDLHGITGSGPDGMVTEADVRRAAEATARSAPAPEKAPATGQALATSAARKLAEIERVDLAKIAGTGTGGRVTEADVSAYTTGRAPAPQPVAPAPPSAPSPMSATGQVIPFVGMRQAIAEHMVGSLRDMAQLTMMTEIDVTELVKMRMQIKEEYELTYTDLLVKAVAKALKHHPILNATLVGEEIQQLSEIHIGVAVALPNGLIVPVVRDADKRSLEEIAAEIRRLAQGARAGTLSVDEVSGSTFTITNLGNYGIDGFTPIINAPEAAILGVGRIIEKPVIYNDQIARRWMLVLSLTVDHRIVDGAPGAEFMKTLARLLEKPYLLI